jgi:hypothetical protein
MWFVFGRYKAWISSGEATVLTEVSPQIHFDVLLPFSARSFKWLFSKKAISAYFPFLVTPIQAT